ncbi:aminopeptidase [Candidatus Woesearchaeota archaeon]|jgi:hypothetical protein|nr:aminopeptidase [Candidatus Woesearchaeota archaeon]MBT3538255.1 aminopeptidase [Candidatus Woesearchaeota archaeon]MBT4697709.1 aminopeptidase [Candidatus Woesearchaeota archaeon]MBT4717421.1 aminopeptidase [Candidatus Woesearchaeota archaeon]MBT7105924.1 aminopeptidase [Candidatus Woesearchaeota archaeon]
MNVTGILDWLKANDLYEDSKKYVDLFKLVIERHLGVSNEKILIIGDTGFRNKRISPIISAAYYFAAQELSLDVDFVMEGVKFRGDSVDPDVDKKLFDLPEESVVVMNLSDKFGKSELVGKSIRKFCRSRGHRFVSTTSLGYLSTDMIDEFVDAYNIDDDDYLDVYDKLEKIFSGAKMIHVFTEAGTNVMYGVEDMKAVRNDGAFQTPASGGNLPIGEVYIPCSKRAVNGRIVIDGSVRTRNDTIIVDDPVVLEIDNGIIVKILGGREAQALEESLVWAESKAKHPWGIRRIGELGVGLNPRAKIMGSTMIDEKTLGTCHFAIGSNAWFGGDIYAIIHLDQVLNNPTIIVDNSIKVMDKGKLLI